MMSIRRSTITTSIALTLNPLKVKNTIHSFSPFLPGKIAWQENKLCCDRRKSKASGEVCADGARAGINGRNLLVKNSLSL